MHLRRSELLGIPRRGRAAGSPRAYRHRMPVAHPRNFRHKLSAARRLPEWAFSLPKGPVPKASYARRSEERGEIWLLFQTPQALIPRAKGAPHDTEENEMSLNKDLTLAKNLAVWLVKEGADSALVDMQDTGVFTVSYVLNGKEQPTVRVTHEAFTFPKGSS